MKIIIKNISLIFLLLVGFVTNVLALTLADGTELEATPIWVVSYIEANLDAIEEVSSLIAHHTTLIGQADGNEYSTGLQRIGRTNQFALVSVWSDEQSRLDYQASNSMNEFRQHIGPFLLAPFDERIHLGLSSGVAGKYPAQSASTIYVLSHVDISPPQQFAPCDLVVPDQQPCANDLLIGLAEKTRLHDGNLRFDVLTQLTRPNHMTVLEAWDSADTQTAYQSSADKVNLRFALSGVRPEQVQAADPTHTLGSMMGSLWDERLYKIILNK